jgi:phospholipid transport system substrate-binding protein
MYRLQFSPILIVSILALLSWAPMLARSEEPVRGFVERLIGASTDLFASDSEDDARRKCHELLGWAFDLDAMAQYALGSAWQTIRTRERRAFRAAFEDLIVAKYVRQARSQRSSTITYNGARPTDDGHWLASTRQVDAGKPDLIWIWRLRQRGQGWRVVDVIADSGSLLEKERAEYARILAEHDGDLNAVIDFIRRRAQG